MILTYYDSQTSVSKKMGQISSTEFYRLLGMQGKYLYYSMYDYLVCMDVTTGIREKIFDLKNNGVDNPMKIQLAFGEGDTLYLRFADGISKDDNVIEITTEPLEIGKAISVVDLASEKNQYYTIEPNVITFSRKNPLSPLVYEKTKDDREAYRTRILAEIAKGEGPEILLVEGEDMQMLFEKGWTADLNEFLSEEQQNKLLPAVMQLGQIDDTFIGLPMTIQILALSTTDTIWDQDSWTISDVMELIKHWKQEKVILLDMHNKRESSAMMVYALSLINLKECPYIDWEKKESNFQNEDFISLLTLIKETEEIPLDSSDLNDGMAKMEYMFGYSTFETTLQQAGKGCRLVGFPNEKGSANFMSSYSYLVVKKETKNKEIIPSF